jgi:hypothetical protein
MRTSIISRIDGTESLKTATVRINREKAEYSLHELDVYRSVTPVMESDGKM